MNLLFTNKTNMKKEKDNLRYVAYARKSTEQEDRQITSIEDQLEEIKRIGEGLKIVKTLKEERSAKTLGRPVFMDMLNMLDNKEVEGIVCWKINRLARNPIDGGMIIWMLQNGVIKKIKTDDGEYTPDSDMIMLHIHFGMAHQFSLNLSKDIKRGLKGKAKAGNRPSVAPLGYRNSKYLGKGFQKILVDDERFPKVRKLFDLMLTGQYTPHQLVDIADKELRLRTRKTKKYPSKPMGKSNMYRILTNPFFFGEYEYPIGSGNWIVGNHKPMITKEEYDRIQAILGKEGKPRPKTHVFAFTGLMRCGVCGGRITAEEKWKHQKNGNTHHYIYYHCTGRVSPKCTEKSVEVKVLEKQIDDFLSSITIPTEFHEWAVEELKKMHAKEVSERNTLLHEHQKEYQHCVTRLNTLTKMMLDGKIKDETARLMEKELLNQKKDLKKLLENDDEETDKWFRTITSALTFAEKAREEFENGDIAKKRQILTALGTEHILSNRKVNIQTEKPLLILEEVASHTNSLHEMLEPVEIVGKKQQIKQMYTNSEILWRWAESNRRANEN
jgi:site-specific DNA recombinase